MITPTISLDLLKTFCSFISKHLSTPFFREPAEFDPSLPYCFYQDAETVRILDQRLDQLIKESYKKEKNDCSYKFREVFIKIVDKQ